MWNKLISFIRRMSLSRLGFPVRLMIVAGFSLALVAVATLGYVAYSNVNRLARLLQDATTPFTFLSNLQDVMVDVTEADNAVRSYTTTGKKEHLKIYNSSAAIYRQKIKLLKDATNGNDSLSNEIKALESLVGRKYGVLLAMIGEVDRNDARTIFERLADKFVDTTAVADTVRKERETFQRIFGARGDSLPPNLSSPGGDKLSKDEFLLQLQRFNEQEQIYLRNKQRRMDSLISRDRTLTLRINTLARNMESEQTAAAQQSALDANFSSARTTRFIGTFTVVVLVLCLTLLIFIVNDLDKNRQLQLRLEAEKARAEILAKAKEEFLANMSHEIRTPMNAVIGFAEQLSDTRLDTRQQRLLDPIRHSANYLLALINDILDYSKLESGNFRLEATGFRPANLMGEVAMTFERSVAAKGITLDCGMKGEMHEVLVGDPLRLRQMLFNLVSNAIKFTEKGGITVRMEELSRQNGQSLVQFTVHDTGIGIEQDQMERIFTEFMQADNSTTRKYGGTGLGLAITRKLAEMHGGRIYLESQPGKGTRAVLEIPYQIGQTTDLEVSPLSPSTQTGNMQLLRGKHALLADDEPYNRELITLIMDKWGVTVDASENGRQLLEKLDKNPVCDFILMDLQMPEMDGITATRQIRSQSKDVPILALTATSTGREIQAALQAGMNAHLLKPFQEHELYEVLLRLLGLNRELPVSALPEPVTAPPALTYPGGRLYSLDELRRLTQGDPRFMTNMLRIFVNTASTHLEQLTRSADAGDWEVLGMTAHKLVPPCRHLGLVPLVEQLKGIEADCKEQERLESLPQRANLAADTLTAIIREVKQDLSELESEAGK
ncbi:MAG: response regulator [Bacteroidetes bacterium]|nr:MAG: response regulator [Bacteroidota bacterium]